MKSLSSQGLLKVTIRIISFRFFLLDAVTGSLTVRTPLTLDDEDPDYYTFSVIAEDSGRPFNRSTSAQVNIKISRGVERLGVGFDYDSYTFDVDENTQFVRSKLIIDN